VHAGRGVKASALLCVSWTLGFRDALALGSSVNRGNPTPTSKRKLLRFMRRHEIIITIRYVSNFLRHLLDVLTALLFSDIVTLGSTGGAARWGGRPTAERGEASRTAYLGQYDKCDTWQRW
jgi:hypothetical protein